MISGKQFAIFTIGWLAYTSTYLLRKPLGVIKSSLKTDLEFSTSQLGWFDTALFLPYALAQLLLGSIGDRIGARKTLAAALILSGISMVSFGSWSNFYVLSSLLLLNGLAQSQCWPNCTKILSSWFSEESKNTVFGIYGTCAFAGGIIGTALAVYLQEQFGWRAVHLFPSLIVITSGLVVFCFYKESSELSSHVTDSVSSEPKHSFYSLWKIGGVPEVAVGIFCLKIVRYCMYMWLPMYLEKQLLYEHSKAGMFSTMFEIGGVVGSALLGAVIDRYFHSSPLMGVTISIILSAVSLVLFELTSSWGSVFNSICLIFAGVFNCGPDTILGGAIPNKLGRSNGRDCASAVTGLVNGFGSIGTFIEGPIIGFVAGTYGWNSMFWCMTVLTLLGGGATFKGSIGLFSDSKEKPDSIV